MSSLPCSAFHQIVVTCIRIPNTIPLTYEAVYPYIPATCNDTCDQNASCVDVDGDLVCQCNEGYTGNGTTCAGMNNANI